MNIYSYNIHLIHICIYNLYQYTYLLKSFHCRCFPQCYLLSDFGLPRSHLLCYLLSPSLRPLGAHSSAAQCGPAPGALALPGSFLGMQILPVTWAPCCKSLEVGPGLCISASSPGVLLRLLLVSLVVFAFPLMSGMLAFRSALTALGHWHQGMEASPSFSWGEGTVAGKLANKTGSCVSRTPCFG